jgi:hypothetical protein
MVACIMIWVTVQPEAGPAHQSAPWPIAGGAWPDLVEPAAHPRGPGLLYSGVATPTEVGAIGALPRR